MLKKYPFSCFSPIYPPFPYTRVRLKIKTKNTAFHAFYWSSMGTEVELELSLPGWPIEIALKILLILRKTAQNLQTFSRKNHENVLILKFYR